MVHGRARRARALRELTLGGRERRPANLRFAVTGGPGAGKTTLLEALAARGLHTVAESARAIIARRRAAGQSPRPPGDAFGREMLRMDVENYRAAPDGCAVLFDRGVVDALSMIAELAEAELREHLDAFPYHPRVFVLPPWRAIYITDAERDHDFAHAVRVHDGLRAWYARCGYEPVEVPRGPLEQRVAFVLEALRAAGAQPPITR